MERQQVRIIGVPLDLGAGHRGVDMGPSAIRITRLQDRLQKIGWDVTDGGDIRTSVYESVPTGGDEKLKHADTVLEVNRQLSEAVLACYAEGEIPLVLGGDHSIAIGSVAGAAAHYAKHQKDLGLIWIDAHADMNTPATTPSGNIHGMSLAIALGIGDQRFTALGNPGRKVKSEHVVLIAARDLDPGEVTALRDEGVRVFTMREIDERGMVAVMGEATEIVGAASAGVYVNFDMDSIDPSVAPGTGTRVPGGLTYREAHLVMETLHDTGKVVGLDLVETNPALDVRNQTAEVATGMVLSLFGKRIMRRRADA